MNEYTTFTGKNVDEAVNNALISLQVPSDRLEYEVVDKGSSGLLGFIGSKPAVIKARRKAEPEEDISAVVKPAVKEAAKAEKKIIENPKKEPEKAEIKEKKPVKPAAEEKPAEEIQPVKNDVPLEEKAEEVPEKKAAVLTSAEGEPDFMAAGREFLTNIFREMDIPVEIDMTYDPEEEAVSVNLTGDKMGLLIGKRGQTLDSLQHLTSLVINKKSENYLRVKLDTENYRERRKENLERLAKSVAGKAKRTRRPVALEPMNPYERRIIHSILQDDKYVYTKSEGEDPYRHVMVIPNQEMYPGKKNYHNSRNNNRKKKDND